MEPLLSGEYAILTQTTVKPLDMICKPLNMNRLLLVFFGSLSAVYLSRCFKLVFACRSLAIGVFTPAPEIREIQLNASLLLLRLAKSSDGFLLV